MPFPLTNHYVLYDLNGNGVVDTEDVNTLIAIMGGAPLPSGVPLSHATTGGAVTAVDVAAAIEVRDGSAFPTVVTWITRSPTDLINIPPQAIITTGSFEFFVRSEVESVVLFVFPNAKGQITEAQLRLLDNTVLESQTSFYGTQGLGFFGSTSGKDLFTQFRLGVGWFKIHLSTVITFNLTQAYFASLAPLDAAQGLINVDIAKNETKNLILQRGATSINLPVPLAETFREFRLSVVPFYHGLQQLDFGKVLDPDGPDWALPPQTTLPEFDLSLTRPKNLSHIHPLSLCGTLPAIPVIITDIVAPLATELDAIICPSGRKSKFKSLDPSLVFISFATLTELNNSDNVNDFKDTRSLAPIITEVLTKWKEFSGFDEKFNFFFYREDSPILAFLDQSQLGRTTYRIHLNLTVLENHPQSNWKDLLGPMPTWASFLHKWFQKQVNTVGPIPNDLALALSYRIGEHLGYKPFYFSETVLGSVNVIDPWLAFFTFNGTHAAEKLEATLDFLDNLFDGDIPSNITSTDLVNAILDLEDSELQNTIDQLVELLEKYDFTEVPPTSTDSVILRNYLVTTVPDRYFNIILPSSEADIAFMNNRVKHGGEPITFSFLCDEVTVDNLGALNYHKFVVDTAVSKKGVSRLLNAWTFADTPRIYSDLLGDIYLDALKSRNLSTLSSDIPAVSQIQIVRSYRVTRHRLLKASFILLFATTQKILAWPDPDSADGIRELPSSFYDLNLGQTILDRLVDEYSTFEPDPPFPSVPSRQAVASSQALFKFKGPTGVSTLLLNVDREVLVSVFRVA